MGIQNEDVASILPQMFCGCRRKQPEQYNNCSPYYVTAQADEEESTYVNT